MFVTFSPVTNMLAFFLLLVLLSNSAQADSLTQFNATEQAFLADLPVVLTPSRLPQALKDAPAAVTVIEGDLIRASGYRDLARILRLIPGMQVGQERSNSHWVTYHGMSNDFPSLMQILVDGRSVYSPGNFGGVDWPALPVTLDEIQRMEIVRGTNSVAYGSNAFLGVVNIITRHAADAPASKLVANAGSVGIQDLRLELSGPSAPEHLRLNAEIKQDDGFSGMHDTQRFKTASLRWDKHINGQHELMFRLSSSNGSRAWGYPDSTYGNNAERWSESLNTALHLQWRHSPSPEEEWLFNYYRNQDRQTETWNASALRLDLSPTRMAYVPLDRNRKTLRDNLEVQHRYAWSEKIRTVWGMEMRRDQANSPFLFYNAAQQGENLRRLFGQMEWRAEPDWSLNLGALAEKFSGDSTRISPRVFSNWQVTANDTVRLGYARAWHRTTLFERNGDIRAFDPVDGALLVQPYLPNPDLRSPHIDSLEIGYLSRFKLWDTRLDLRLFNERIEDYVYRVSHPEVTAPLLSSALPSSRYENLVTPVILRGLEYQLDSRPLPGTRLLFSHTLIGRSCADPSIRQLTAPYSASLSWMQKWDDKWSSMLSVFRMGPLAGGDGFVPRYHYASAAYTTLDARIAYTARIDGKPIEIALVATNLGGRHQEIADRSEQFLHGTVPANQTSPMVWLSLALASW